MDRNLTALSHHFHFLLCSRWKILEAFARQSTGHTKPSPGLLKLNTGGSAPHQKLPPAPSAPRWAPPGATGYNTPAWPFPKAYHFPVAFLDVLILEGFIQAKAGRKNNNHQVSKEPRVSHPLPKTCVLQYETWKNVKD